MYDAEIQANLLRSRDDLRNVRERLKTTLKAGMDENKHRHIQRSLTSI